MEHSLPKRGRKVLTAEACAIGISSALRRRYGHERNVHKRLAARLDTTQHAVKAWMAGKNAPSLAKALQLAAECDEVAEQLKSMIEEARCAARSS